MDNNYNKDSNDFFNENLNYLIELKKELTNEIYYYESSLKTKKTMLKSVKGLISKQCNHKFESDIIDYGLDGTKIITYCVYCEETK